MNLDQIELPDFAAPFRWVRDTFFQRKEGIAFLFWPTMVYPRNGSLSWYEEGYRRPYRGWLEFVRYTTSRPGWSERRVFRPFDQKP